MPVLLPPASASADELESAVLLGAGDLCRWRRGMAASGSALELNSCRRSLWCLRLSVRSVSTSCESHGRGGGDCLNPHLTSSVESHGICLSTSG